MQNLRNKAEAHIKRQDKLLLKMIALTFLCGMIVVIDGVITPPHIAMAQAAIITDPVQPPVSSDSSSDKSIPVDSSSSSSDKSLPDSSSSMASSSIDPCVTSIQLLRDISTNIAIQNMKNADQQYLQIVQTPKVQDAAIKAAERTFHAALLNGMFSIRNAYNTYDKSPCAGQ